MDQRKERPQTSPKGQTEAEARRQRQAEALRANLARRKAQTRAREDTDGQDTQPSLAPDGGKL